MPSGQLAVSEKKVPRSVAAVRPKSARFTAQLLSTLEGVCLFHSSVREEASTEYLTHSLKIPVNNLEVMRVGSGRYNLRKGPQPMARYCWTLQKF